MSFSNQRAFDRALLVERVRAIAPLDLHIGSPAAEAVADALLADARVAGRRSGDLNNVPEAKLWESATDLIVALEYGNRCKVDLPFGSAAHCSASGTIRIGAQHYVIDVDAPGLHPTETVRRDASGSNLEMLHHEIEKATRKLACRRLGLPHPVTIFERERQLLQFEPFAEAGDMVLQRRVDDCDAPRFCAATPAQIKAFAASIVADMRVAWKRRVDLRRRVAEIRADVEALCADGNVAGTSVNLGEPTVAIDLSGQHDNELLDVYVQFSGIDNSLREGIVFDHASGWADRFSACQAISSIEWRRSDLERFKLEGATGEIDDVAAAVAAIAPDGLTAVLQRLGESNQVFVDINGDQSDLYATLSWENGKVSAEVSMAGVFDFFRGQLELFKCELPMTASTAAKGRKLSEIVKLPFECDSVITKVETVYGGGMRFELEVGVSLFCSKTGRVWRHHAEVEAS